jgi:putative ABC transport system ATP-binding protein
MPLYELSCVSRVFGAGTAREVRAVDQVSLRVEVGEFVVLVGPSGSGKTTLLALLGALDRPSAGSLQFADENLSACSDAALARVRRRLGFIFQDFALLPRLSIADNIAYPLIPRGVSRQQRRDIASALLSRFGMAGLANKRPEQLSGGERQRVAIARALAGDPDVILADEPTSNLDLRAGQAIIGVCRELHALGRTIIVASHDRAFLSCATRTVEMHMGQAIVDTRTADPTVSDETA